MPIAEPGRSQTGGQLLAIELRVVTGFWNGADVDDLRYPMSVQNTNELLHWEGRMSNRTYQTLHLQVRFKPGQSSFRAILKTDAGLRSADFGGGVHRRAGCESTEGARDTGDCHIASHYRLRAAGSRRKASAASHARLPGSAFDSAP